MASSEVPVGALELSDPGARDPFKNRAPSLDAAGEQPSRVPTPPTSEDKDKKDGINPAQSLCIDDDWEIEPDHYWDGGKIPVFKPTMHQFRDFEKFIDKVNKYGMKSGIVKVVPPEEWRQVQPELSEAIKAIRVKNPITQEFAGTHGAYSQANIEKQRSYNLPQWKALCQESNHTTPARRGERRRQFQSTARPKPPSASIAKNANANALTVRRGRGRPRKSLPTSNGAPVPIPEVEKANHDAIPLTSTSSAVKEEQGAGKECGSPKQSTAGEGLGQQEDQEGKTQVEYQVVQANQANQANHTLIDVKPNAPETSAILVPPVLTPPTKRGRGRPPKAKPGGAIKNPATKPKSRSTPRSKADTKTSVAARRINNTKDIVEIDEAAFEGFDYHLDDIGQFTTERCRELEETYWKTINFGTPMYGADMPGSLFDEGKTPCWNVAKLPNLLDALGTKVPGVNTAYLYLGMWKATFAWHLEDVDLYSINYIHFGAPKQWYSISQADARRFEAAMRTMWPNDAKHCDQFLRHKTYLISPEKLKKDFNITVNRLVHYQGEFVITYPYGYHSGFNLGYNCAESVNFANESWLDFGRVAKKCECESDSVWVDVHEIERKLRGEATPEYYEVTDDEDDGADHLPSPPPSEAPKRGRKRRLDSKAKEPDRKVKKIRIRIKTSSREPCILCPNDVPSEKLLKTDTGKYAHRSCALFTPETFLLEDAGDDMVCNISGISKARLELRCMYCRVKKGTCFQCSSKKCHRAYHATCAAPAGVQIDTGLVPTWDEDGTEYYCEGYDFRCRFHRARRPKGTTIDLLEASSLIDSFGQTIKPGMVIQAQSLDGDIFAGLVLYNLPGEKSCIVDIMPEGDRIEVQWKYLLVLDPADSLRPKPSLDAKPLPAHLLKKPAYVSASNRKDGVPSEGDPFHDSLSGHKWAQFEAANAYEIRNPNQIKVDLAKADQIWYYLGKNATEAKPQYTHDLRVSTHDSRSNFLDRVKALPSPQLPSSRPSLASHQSSYGLILQPRPEKPYQYKPKIVHSGISTNNINFPPKLPEQRHQSVSAPTISPQQMHWGSYSSADMNFCDFPSPTQQLPSSDVWSHQLSTTTARQHALLGQQENQSHKPFVPPIDIAAAQAVQTSHLQTSPSFNNFYSEAEERYSSQQTKTFDQSYQILANGRAADSGKTIIRSVKGNSGSREDMAIATTSSKPFADTVALASLRNMPPGSLPLSPSLTRIPFTPPSRRPDIKHLINNTPDEVKPPKISTEATFLRRPRTSTGPPKLNTIHKRSYSYTDAGCNHSARSDSSFQAMSLSSLAVNPKSIDHSHSDSHSFICYDRYSAQPTYQSSTQLASQPSTTGAMKSTTRFDEFIKQLQDGPQSGSLMTNGIGPNTSSILSNSLSNLPPISAEQMDIFRDSVVFTPPPEAQKSLAMAGVSEAKKMYDSPERERDWLMNCSLSNIDI